MAETNEQMADRLDRIIEDGILGPLGTAAVKAGAAALRAAETCCLHAKSCQIGREQEAD
jgi:acyl CoA:acetate/3-ketoacid CoA transferase beta subunit